MVQLLRRLASPAGDADLLTPPLALGTDEAEARRLADAVARLLPAPFAPLFDARFTRSDRLFDVYVSRLTVEIARTVGLDRALAKAGTVEDVVRRAGLDPRCATVPVAWMLRRLAACGLVAMKPEPGAPRFHVESPLPDADAGATRAEQEAHDATALPSYTLAELAARSYPALLAGTQTGEALLLGPARLALWRSYFANSHSLYAVNNRVGALAVAAALREVPGPILELGAGMGGGTTAVLETLRDDGRLAEVTSYRVTDLVPMFLRYAQRDVETAFPGLGGVGFGALDMNRAFGGQGVAPERVAIVYAVNTLHVADDLAFTLGEIRRALVPGGRLVLAECIRPMPGQTLYPELVFNMLATFRQRGFLTPEEWSAALGEAGFVDVRLHPDIARVRDAIPTLCVAAITATRA